MQEVTTPYAEHTDRAARRSVRGEQKPGYRLRPYIQTSDAAEPLPKAHPPHPVLPPPLPTDARFLGTYGPLLFFSVLILIPVVSVALLLTSPSDDPFQQLTPEEWTSLARYTPLPTDARPPASLDVTSDPDGTLVYVDDEFAGIAPYLNDEIPSGWRTVTLKKKGYAARDSLLYLEAGRTTALSFTLAPIDDGLYASANVESGPERTPTAHAAEAVRGTASHPGTGELQIDTSPARVQVHVDGEPAGASSLLLDGLAPGTHEIALSLPGHASRIHRVVVVPGERVFLQADLVPLTGTLSVVVHPWGSIYIDGTLHARDTDLRYDVDLPAGPHVVRAVHPILGAQELRVDVKADQQASVAFDLH